MQSPEPVRGTVSVHNDRVFINLELVRPAGPIPLPVLPGVAFAEPPAAGPPPHGKPSHSPDFSVVVCDGVTYTFGPTQRAVVALLWKAWEDGFNHMHQDALLEHAESTSQRLRDLFRNHPAWGRLIVGAHLRGGPLGAYQLAFAR